MPKTTKQKGILSPIDLDNLRFIIRQEVSEEVAFQLEQQLTEKLAFLPTKDEFFSKMDQVLGEVQKMREDFAAHKMSHERIDEDTSKLKKQVKHLFTTFEIKDPIEVAASI